MRYFALGALLALAACADPSAAPPPIVVISPAPVKQVCLAPAPYTAEQQKGFAAEDTALIASGKFPLTVLRLTDYHAERDALRACAAAQH